MHRAGQRYFELLALIGSPQLLQQSYSPSGQDSWPNWTNLKGLQSGRGFVGNKRFFTCGTSKNNRKNRSTLVLRTAIGYPYYKGSPCVTTEIITDKFDVLRGRLLGNHNDFASAALQALKVCPVRPRVLSSWGITLLEELRAADER